jgi:hypothetical protein
MIRIRPILPLCLLALACTPDSDLEIGETLLDPIAHADEVERWAAVREQWLPSATGPFSQTGLCHIRSDELPGNVGADSLNSICITPGPRAPALVGRLVANGDSLVLQADSGLFWVGEKSIREAHVIAIRDKPEIDGAAAWRGSIRLTGRWAEGEIVVWVVDTLAEARTEYNGVERWPVDPAMSFDAQFTPSNEGWQRVATVRGFDLPREKAGTVTIIKDGEKHELTALAKGRGSTSWLVVFRDPTSDTEESYPAGRFLDVEFADSTGHTIIDFNRARNPDCAFTDASPCPLPPSENWFDERIEAGEKKYGG